MSQPTDFAKWREELRRRAFGDPIMTSVLNTAQDLGWSDEQANAWIACALSDSNARLRQMLNESLLREMLQPIMHTTGSGEKKVAVYLGNYARPMFDALTKITKAARNWHDFHHQTMVPCDAICEALPDCEDVLAKIDGGK